MLQQNNSLNVLLSPHAIVLRMHSSLLGGTSIIPTVSGLSVLVTLPLREKIRKAEEPPGGLCLTLLLLLPPTVPLLTCGSLRRSSSGAESVSRTEMWPVIRQGEGKRSPFHRVTLSGGCYGPPWTSTPSVSGPVKTTDRRACTCAHRHTTSGARNSQPKATCILGSSIFPRESRPGAGKSPTPSCPGTFCRDHEGIGVLCGTSVTAK